MHPPTIESPVAEQVHEPNSQRPSRKFLYSLSKFDADKFALISLVLLIAYAAARSLCQAVTRPLWYDEICTWIMVQQHPISVFWNAVKDALDGQPPLFYLLERPVAAAIANEQVSYRLLSILGFSCTIACLFFLIRKRSGNINALICAAIPLATLLYDPYAVEARPYTLVIACVAIALLCYDRAPEVGWTLLMGLSLALADSLHYYAVLALAPFFLAEIALTLRIRRPRWTVWLALCASVIPVAASWPLLSRQRAYYGEHFWAQPSLLGAESSYGWFFRTTLAWGVGLVATAALAVLLTMLVEERAAERGEHREGALFHQRVLVLGFLALPFLSFFAAKLAHGGMTERYMLPAVLGFPLAAGYTLPRCERRNATLFAALAVCLVFTLAPQERRFWSSYNGTFVSPAKSVETLVASANQADLPVVVSDPHDFLQFAHYASPGWEGRFVSIVDAPQAVIYSGNDTGDKELAVIRSYTTLRIYDFAPFVAEHPVFLLYSGNGGAGLDWWPPRLLRDGYTLRPVAVRDMYHRVFLVSRGKSPATIAQGTAAPVKASDASITANSR
jgi:4-amino-4-deoxy-L-arabinose transferase-like glycosyltransferase